MPPANGLSATGKWQRDHPKLWLALNQHAYYFFGVRVRQTGVINFCYYSLMSKSITKFQVC